MTHLVSYQVRKQNSFQYNFDSQYKTLIIYFRFAPSAKLNVQHLFLVLFLGRNFSRVLFRVPSLPVMGELESFVDHRATTSLQRAALSRQPAIEAFRLGIYELELVLAQIGRSLSRSCRHDRLSRLRPLRDCVRELETARAKREREGGGEAREESAILKIYLVYLRVPNR